MRTSALFGEKTSDFQGWEGGVEPEQTFCKQEGGGQFFPILCGRPLWTALKKITIGFGK